MKRYRCRHNWSIHLWNVEQAQDLDLMNVAMGSALILEQDCTQQRSAHIVNRIFSTNISYELLPCVWSLQAVIFRFGATRVLDMLSVPDLHYLAPTGRHHNLWWFAAKPIYFLIKNHAALLGFRALDDAQSLSLGSSSSFLITSTAFAVSRSSSSSSL